MAEPCEQRGKLMCKPEQCYALVNTFEWQAYFARASMGRRHGSIHHLWLSRVSAPSDLDVDGHLPSEDGIICGDYWL